MDETLEKDGYRIDRASQVILRALNSGDEWTRGKTLRKAADLSQNGQVFYRMEEHLIPAGLVQEAARTGRSGHVEPRRFRLTDEGMVWVEEHAEVLAIPVTREEIAAKAGKAYEAAESARESVQGYRKKLYRVKGRVEDLEELPERVRETETKLQYRAESLNEIRSRLTDTEESIEESREVMEHRQREIDMLQEQNAALREDVKWLEAKLEGTTRQQAEREQDRHEYLMYPNTKREWGKSLASFAVILVCFVYVYTWGNPLAVILGGVVGSMVYGLLLERHLPFDSWPRFSS